MDFVLKNFELVLSAILNEKRGVSSYPPKLVRGTYGYQGQHPRPNCVETAFQDFLNIWLYNPQTQLFDLSLLPPGLQLNEAFKKFYEDYKDPNQSSDKTGQPFMNMVSNISGVDYYGQKNYELNAKADNFLKVANHLLGTEAQDLTELGRMLSDQRRTITFTLHTPNDQGITKISMLIKDNKTSLELRADLGFSPGHGEISVVGRDEGDKTSLLAPAALASNYTISQEAQALFSIQPPSGKFISKYLLSGNIPASFYYIPDADGDWNKVGIIEKILSDSINNEEALDYALHLYKELDLEAEIKVFDKIIESGIWRSHPKFKELLINLKNRVSNADDSYASNRDRLAIIKSILKHDANDIELMNYASDIFQQPSRMQ